MLLTPALGRTTGRRAQSRAGSRPAVRPPASARARGQRELPRAPHALVWASMLRIDAARITLTGGSARITLAGAGERFASSSLLRIFASGTHPPRGDFRRRGAVRQRERRVRPCISLAPCLCRPSVGDVGIVHVGAGTVALPVLLARRPAASILRAPSRPYGSQCATGSGVLGERAVGAAFLFPTVPNCSRRGSGVREFWGSAPLPRHCTASVRRGQDG